MLNAKCYASNIMTFEKYYIKQHLNTFTILNFENCCQFTKNRHRNARVKYCNLI